MDSENWSLAIAKLQQEVANNIRAFRKLASDREFIEDSERKTGVYLRVYEDLSTEPAHKFLTKVECTKRSILKSFEMMWLFISNDEIEPTIVKQFACR